MAPRRIEVHVVSDSTGDTGARVARATVAQFGSHDAGIVRHAGVTGPQALDRAVERIRRQANVAAVVFSTLVDPDLRASLATWCGGSGVPHVDLIGPAIAAVESATATRAEYVMARLVGLDPDYFKRVAAMEFAIRHDDGQLAVDLPRADVVLIGVSRAGKTPLSMYLGYLGHKTANVPLVPGVAPPDQLFAVDRWKIVGLTIDPDRLSAIRGRRIRAVGSGRKYADLEGIYAELEDARILQQRLRCPVIDTTSLAVEEAAQRVWELVSERRRAAQGMGATAGQEGR